MDEPLPNPMTAIMRLNRSDPRNAEFEQIKSDISTLARNIEISGKGIGNDLFFRARKNIGKKPSNLSDLGIPPVERTVGFQRCNGPNEPMFYTGSRRITALLEIGVEPGDIVYLSQWTGETDSIVVNITLDLKSKFNNFEKLSPRSQAVLIYFDTIFTRRIHKTYSDDYKFTVAATHALTRDLLKKDASGNLIKKTLALRYASVVDLEKSYNTAFYPEQATKLIPMHVAELRIDDVQERVVSATLLDTAIRFEPSGNIMWTGDLKLVPSLRREDRAVTYRSAGNGQWDVDTVDRILNKEEFHDFLNE